MDQYKTRSDTLKLRRMIEFLKESGNSEAAKSLEESSE